MQCPYCREMESRVVDSRLVAGGTVTWSGVLAAPNGIAQLNANTLRGGSVIAAAIQMSASDVVIA